MATTKIRSARAARPVSNGAGQAVESIVNKVGEKISRLRRIQGLSLQQLADKSDVSPAAIHKIERSGMVPTITTLLKLGNALGMPTSYFVQEDEIDPEPVHFTGGANRPPVYTSHRGLSLNSIAGSYRQFQTAAAIARVAPGATSGQKLLKHPGEELVHVVSGEMLFKVGNQDYRLAAGDSLHFGGEIPHHWENPSKKPAELVWIALRGGL